jgi:two-component system OmpR family response regulator
VVRILVVEDDADVGNFLVTGLGESGYQVDWAANGRDGMARALADQHDLIILDRQLGDGIDGVDILKAVRDTGRTVPALFLSGLGELSDWVQGLQAGGDDYLVKPVSLEELLQRVEALTNRDADPSDTAPALNSI